jgi:hypothetical protein
MDDEQRGGNSVNKGLGNAIMDGGLNSLTLRPTLSIVEPRRTSISKRDTSGSRDLGMLKATSVVATSVTLPFQDNVPKSPEHITAAKDEYMTPNPVEGPEQRPVVPFWDEKDSIDQSQQRSTASGGVMPQHDRSQNLAERNGKGSLLARIDTSIPLPTNFLPTQSSQEVVIRQNKWKPLGRPAESSSGSHEPRKPSVVVGSVPPALNLGPASTMVPTGPKHRDGTRNSGNKQTWRGPNKMTREVPTEPRSMRKVRTTRPDLPLSANCRTQPDTSTGSAVSEKTAHLLSTPKSELTRSPGPEIPATLKVQEPATLEAEEPPNLKLVNPPKEIKDFQIVTSIGYSSMVSTFITGAANDGSPLHMKGFPICSQKCELSRFAASDGMHLIQTCRVHRFNAAKALYKESLVRGKLGCTHSASVDLPCLSTSLPKEVSHRSMLFQRVHRCSDACPSL